MITILLIGALTGCGNKRANTTLDIESNTLTLYYLNKEETRLVGQDIDFTEQEHSLKENVDSLLKYLAKQPDTKDLKPSLKSEIDYQGMVTKNKICTLDFSIEYNDMSPSLEILTRAAIIKTLVQLRDVNGINITVSGQPLMDKNDLPIGILTDESFVENNRKDGSYNQFGDIMLYFADLTGTYLIEYPVRIEISNNKPIEQIIIEQLIIGPTGEGVMTTIPADTKVLSTSTKDGVCYVDLNSKFLSPTNVKDDVIIYSIVNSLVDLPTVHKVQFTIEGKKVEKYREGLVFNGVFERNLELVEVK